MNTTMRSARCPDPDDEVVRPLGPDEVVLLPDPDDELHDLAECDDLETARLMIIAADALSDRRGCLTTGIIRQGAHRLKDHALRVAADDRVALDGCEHCGAPLTGRKQRWCSESCRARHHRSIERASTRWS